MKHSISSTRFDVIVAGGGMVGMTAAIALATAGIRVAVVEPVAPPSQIEEQFDGRVSAIALSSQRLLKQIGAWPFMAPHGEPIRDIRVVDAHSHFFLDYDHQEIGDDPFGWIVENRHTRTALFQRAAMLPEMISLFSPVAVKDFDIEPGHVSVTLTDGRDVSAPLLVAADGKFSKIREKAGIKAVTIPYNQTAIVCTIDHSKPHEGLALERFLPIGPFAVLPMQNNRSSLVWTESNETAPLLLGLADDELVEEITRRVGDYLGTISLTGPRFSYPLSLVHASDYTTHRLALIGDAAHAIHPIAGQGVNLGFRDVAALAEVLVDAKRLGLDLGFATQLARYGQWRSFDSLAMIAVTDGLNRLFSNSIFPISAARKAGMAAVGKMPTLKRFFMRHAMGLEGDLPRLLRGEAL